MVFIINFCVCCLIIICIFADEILDVFFITFLLPDYNFLCIEKSKFLLNHIESYSLSPSKKTCVGCLISHYGLLNFFWMYTSLILCLPVKKVWFIQWCDKILAFKSLKKLIPMAYLSDMRKFYKSYLLKIPIYWPVHITQVNDGPEPQKSATLQIILLSNILILHIPFFYLLDFYSTLVDKNQDL